MIPPQANGNNRRPQFDMRLDLGNIITIVVLIVSAALAVGAAKQEANDTRNLLGYRLQMIEEGQRDVAVEFRRHLQEANQRSIQLEGLRQSVLTLDKRTDQLEATDRDRRRP